MCWEVGCHETFERVVWRCKNHERIVTRKRGRRKRGETERGADKSGNKRKREAQVYTPFLPTNSPALLGARRLSMGPSVRMNSAWPAMAA